MYYKNKDLIKKLLNKIYIKFNSMKTQTTYVYWEKQGTDRLCGVHCINSLLQGPFYDEV